jgi:hypothetical protein
MVGNGINRISGWFSRGVAFKPGCLVKESRAITKTESQFQHILILGSLTQRLFRVPLKPFNAQRCKYNTV